AFSRVEYVPVILESNLRAFDLAGIVHVGDHATPFFFGREAFHQDIALIRHQPGLNVVTVLKSIGFLVQFRVLQLAAREVMWVDKRDRVSHRVGKPISPQPEIDDGSGADLKSDLLQGMLKEMSARVDVSVFGWNMDENFRIGRLNDFSEWKCPLTVLGETLVMGRGNNDVALFLAPDEFYNHILLQ